MMCERSVKYSDQKPLGLLWSAEYDAWWDQFLSRQFQISRSGMNVTDNYDDNFLTTEQGGQLAEALQGQELFLVGYDLVTQDVLDRTPELKMILSVRDGPEENIDIDACTRRGIPVLFSGGRCARCVAELNLLLMFLLARPVIASSNAIRRDKWTDDNYMDLVHRNDDATELFGKTVGIIGLGRNGRLLAQIAHGIGMKVLAYDPYARQDETIRFVTFGTLEEVLRSSDYICCLARVTPETSGMIGAREFSWMKPSACFINTGRAELTDEDALLDALEENRIRAAAIDVFSREPLGLQSRFYTISEDRLILTPHIAGFARERIPHQYELLWEQYSRFLMGDRNINIKNPDVFDSPAFAERGGLLFGSAAKARPEATGG